MHVREATDRDEAELVSELLVPSYRESESIAPEFNALNETALDDVDASYWLDDDDRILFVGVEAGALVGHVSGTVVTEPPIYERDRRIHVDGLYVKPDHRRGGVASALLQRIEQWGSDRGCEYVGVAVHVDNDRARELYDQRYTPTYRSYRATIE